jgi:hypothetical protein
MQWVREQLTEKDLDLQQLWELCPENSWRIWLYVRTMVTGPASDYIGELQPITNMLTDYIASKPGLEKVHSVLVQIRDNPSMSHEERLTLTRSYFADIGRLTSFDNVHGRADASSSYFYVGVCAASTGDAEALELVHRYLVLLLHKGKAFTFPYANLVDSVITHLEYVFGPAMDVLAYLPEPPTPIQRVWDGESYP